MTRKSGKHPHATFETLNSCFDFIGSHQQCIPRSPPLEIEPATPECRNRTSVVKTYFQDILDHVVARSYRDWLIWHAWRQHPTRHKLYGHLPPITKTIQGRRTRHTGRARK